jgi:hypothetical protein
MGLDTDLGIGMGMGMGMANGLGLVAAVGVGVEMEMVLGMESGAEMVSEMVKEDTDKFYEAAPSGWVLRNETQD